MVRKRDSLILLIVMTKLLEYIQNYYKTLHMYYEFIRIRAVLLLQTVSGWTWIDDFCTLLLWLWNEIWEKWIRAETYPLILLSKTYKLWEWFEKNILREEYTTIWYTDSTIGVSQDQDDCTLVSWETEQSCVNLEFFY